MVVWYNAVIVFSSDSDDVRQYWTEAYTIQQGWSQVPVFKNKNIYIVRHSASDPQTLQWFDAGVW